MSEPWLEKVLMPLDHEVAGVQITCSMDGMPPCLVYSWYHINDYKRVCLCPINDVHFTCVILWINCSFIYSQVLSSISIFLVWHRYIWMASWKHPKSFPRQGTHVHLKRRPVGELDLLPQSISDFCDAFQGRQNRSGGWALDGHLRFNEE